MERNHVFLVGRLSLERKTYNVAENEGNVKICTVLLEEY